VLVAVAVVVVVGGTWIGLGSPEVSDVVGFEVQSVSVPSPWRGFDSRRCQAGLHQHDFVGLCRKRPCLALPCN
jgi:hypothetical protein